MRWKAVHMDFETYGRKLYADMQNSAKRNI